MLSSIVPFRAVFAGATEPREKAELNLVITYGQGPPHSAVKMG